MIPFPIDPPPVAIDCASVGQAIDILRMARENCLRASYLPHGGQTCKKDEPITHQVWVMGDPHAIETLKAALEQP